MKTENWQNYLSQYWDSQLISFPKFGFPLDSNQHVQLKCDNTNHKSVLLYPDHVDKCISEERQFKAIHGPYKMPPFSDIQCSPFITCEKAGGNKHRVIVDLIWPAGNVVNDGVYQDSYFILTYPSVDDITAKVARLGKGCLPYKVDVGWAFLHIKTTTRGTTTLILACLLDSNMEEIYFSV